jgi:tripartite-type tricarboxylate transporter receptor subunit TctC
MKLFLPLILAFGCAVTQAQTWPDKQVTLLVPFPPGGSTDTVARAIAPKLQQALGGTFVVDNKPGAGGTIGAAQVARARPTAAPSSSPRSDHWSSRRT